MFFCISQKNVVNICLKLSSVLIVCDFRPFLAKSILNSHFFNSCKITFLKHLITLSDLAYEFISKIQKKMSF